MNEASNAFKEDVMNRKSMLSGARHRKRGSHSKKCTLPSDNLSYYQKQKLNGEVKTYKMDGPMSWGSFKKLPLDIQEEYLQKLVSEYNISLNQLSQMLGVAKSTLSTYIKNNKFSDVNVFKRGSRVSPEDLSRWNEFLDSYGHVVEPKKDPEHTTSKSDEHPVKLTNWSIGFEGEIQTKDVVAYLQLVLGDSFKGSINISYTNDVERC